MSSKINDSIQSIEEELCKVESKLDDFDQKWKNEVNACLSELIRLRDIHNSPEISANDAEEKFLLERVSVIKDQLALLVKQHREIHPIISKFGRTLDKAFLCEPEVMSQMLMTSKSTDDQTSNELLNMAICEKLMRQGYHDVLDQFIKETGVTCDHLEPIVEIGRIVDALHRHDLGPAMRWVSEHRTSLENERSLLEFQLERLRFIELLRKPGGPDLQGDLLLQARRLAALPLCDRTELCHVMGSLLFLNRGLAQSPYAEMLDESQWESTAREFAMQACRLAGLNQECPLDVAFDKGYTSMPRLFNMSRQVEKMNMGALYEEMALSMELADAHEYHNVFCCPILRSHCTITNPPMRLDCGHAVSKDAVLKLSQSGRLKCPYCPREMDPKSPQELFF